jgi:hypothetical protein
MGRHGIVENYSSIDVNELHRSGAFARGAIEFPYVGFRITALSMMRTNCASIDVQFIKDKRWQSIPVRWTRCHFGGQRHGSNAYAGGAWPSFTMLDFVLGVMDDPPTFRISLPGARIRGAVIARYSSNPALLDRDGHLGLVLCLRADPLYAIAGKIRNWVRCKPDRPR